MGLLKEKKLGCELSTKTWRTHDHSRTPITPFQIDVGIVKFKEFKTQR